MENEIQYFTRRAAEELRAADAAATPEARASHRTLAEYYAERVREKENALTLEAPAAPVA